MRHLSPVFWVKIYTAVLLFLFLLGATESRVDSEGMGFLPLMAFTTPWSWLLTSTWDFPIWGKGFLGRQLMVFVTCNALSGTANSYILYVLLKRRQRKMAGTEPSAGE
jgi:hypothetical protein